MIEAKRNRFKEILQKQDIDTPRKGLSIVGNTDPIDQVLSIADRALVRRDFDRIFEILKPTPVAPREPRNRTLGVSVHCGDKVPGKRLDDTPSSRFHISNRANVETLRPMKRRSENNASYSIAGPRRGLFKRRSRPEGPLAALTLLA